MGFLRSITQRQWNPRDFVTRPFEVGNFSLEIFDVFMFDCSIAALDFRYENLEPPLTFGREELKIMNEIYLLYS